MKHSYFLNRLLLFSSLIFLFAFSSVAQTIKGKVDDYKTGEPLAGATVHLTQQGVNKIAPVNLNGAYIFKNVRTGPYKIQVNFIGYKSLQTYEGNINSADEIKIINIDLQDASTQVAEVKITGQGNKETDRAARGIEKNASMIQNILSANTIKLLPDVTVANALQRVSGVSILRSPSGEGRYAIIRGMEQRYNSTLVNGIKIPSPDPAYRFVPMDIFPSEMLDRLEIIKALTPSMEGDAIGGVMNLVMKSAPNQFVLSANVSGGFSSLFSSGRPFVAFNPSVNGQSPASIHGNSYAATYSDFNNTAITSDKNMSTPFSSTAGLTIGDRFLDNKLGVIVSASYQNIYRGSNSKRLIPNAQPDFQPLPNSPQFSDSYDRTYSTQTQRLGIHNKIDYVFDNKNKISLYNLYIHQNEYESRLSSDTLGLGLNSTAFSKQITLSNRSTLTQQTIYNSTLHGEHLLGDEWKFTWDGVYSRATRNMPDRTEFSYDANKAINSAGAVTNEYDNNTVLTHHWENNKDQDISGYANLIYTPKIAGKPVEFSTGGLFRHKIRDAYYMEYTLKGGSTLYNNNFSSIPFTLSSPIDGTGNSNTNLANNYHITENDNAEYVQAKFDLLPKLQVLGGVRIENTNLSYLTQSPITVSARSGKYIYTDVLPSVHLKYALTDEQNLRASYFASISRPGFGEQVPYQIDGEYYKEEGNPNLKHITADNYDLRYEFFPGGADQLLLGSFYKKIYNPIEYYVVRGSGPSDLLIQPQNDPGNATNYGFEALATKFFGIIGFSANYTYTHSRVTTPKLLYAPTGANGQPMNSIIDETRPLQGQANHVGNASILFKSAKLGLDMQLAYVYTGERLAQVSAYANLDFYQHAYGQLDFSFEKTIAKHFSFYGKINNLTNAAARIYLKYPHDKIKSQLQEFLGKQDIAAQTLVQSDYYKTLFLGGFRYKL
ncbi:TonB-dependent receptor [Mucilaginibacter sp. SG564]|uniref:TonB-dependent receptor n=1 Tax=Mucilaginibacter sp. SG564 TaxID=2587022 RepID=UPI001554DB4A|nr:TonB-dependent receptor [Mucilaginibacter sp. SG564]NOW94683.1 outer membrane receptor protein involved in Fe transport [Mucilaginibacter sp. SG564]